MALFDGMADTLVGIFGRDVMLTDAEGAEHAATGVFRHRTIESLDVIYREPTLTLLDADAALIDSAAPAVQVSVDSVAYRPLRPFESDGHGTTLVRLERSA